MAQLEIQHRRLTPNGTELHFVEAGPREGPLLILLHGFPEFWFAWRDYLAPFAAAGFHVVAPDQRGYNLSGKPKGVDAYRLDALADDIDGLARLLGHSSFRVAGHDWGGLVAWWIATRQPSRLTHMAVLNAPHPAVWRRAMQRNPEQRKKSGYVRLLRLPWIPELAVRLGGYKGLAKAFDSARPGAFSDTTLVSYDDAWRQPGALTASLNWYRALFRQDMSVPDPGTLSTPCLVLWGDADAYWDPGARG